jgi:hypothetical protein
MLMGADAERLKTAALPVCDAGDARACNIAAADFEAERGKHAIQQLKVLCDEQNTEACTYLEPYRRYGVAP